MKTKILSLITVLLLGSTVLFAKDKKEEFLVNGKCEMCKKSIEMAALSVNGVSKANWNMETKTIAVTLDDSKTDVDKIHQSIVKVGYDTKLHKATDEAYNSLPDCCKYDRSKLEAPKKPVKYEHR